MFSYGYAFNSLFHYFPWPTMQFAIIICMLFVGLALSVTTTTRTTLKPPSATTVGKATVPQVLKPAMLPTATGVKNSIVNWETSVNIVNDYPVGSLFSLGDGNNDQWAQNNPENKTKLTSAIVIAMDEPVQLETLMKLAALLKAGVNAGSVLMGNFPSIVSNFE
jgi:hypothetical protein